MPELPDPMPVAEGEIPEFTVDKGARPQELSQACKKLEQVYACKGCDGSGSITFKKKVGERNANKIFRRPILADAERDCKSCRSIGYGDPEKIHGRLADVILKWSELNREVPQPAADQPKSKSKAEEQRKQLDFAVEQAKALLKQVASLQPEHVEQVLNPRIIKALAEGKAETGQPHFVAGWVVSDEALSVPGFRTKMVELISSRGMYVLILDPLGADALVREPVIAGGRFAGFMKNGNGGSNIAVLVDGFAFSTVR